MKHKTAVILTWALALFPAVITALLYSRLPEQIPMQWRFDGAVRYDPKSSIWMMTGLGPLLALILLVLPKIDPLRKNYAKFQDGYDLFSVVIMLFLLLMNAVILSESFYPGRLRVERLVTAGIGILFVMIGNLLPRVKQNYFMGFKTPWTLSDPLIWNRTNRLGGYLFFFGGLTVILLSFLLRGTALFAAFLAVTLFIVLLPTVMSYCWHRKGSSAQE